MTGVIQYTFSGKPVASYDSIEQASRKTGIGRSVIQRCIRTGEPDRNTGYLFDEEIEGTRNGNQ